MSKKKARIVSQGLFLLLFLFLFIQTESKGDDTLGYPVRLFLDFDPLIFIYHAFCCPCGQYPRCVLPIDHTDSPYDCPGQGVLRMGMPSWNASQYHKFIKEKALHESKCFMYKAKYYILIVLIVSSLFTLQIAGILDPISLLIRSFSASIYPLMNYGIRGFFDAIYNIDVRGVVTVSEAIYGFLKNSILSFRQPYYLQTFFLGLLFFGILSLNFIERRFWCRYLCPLGALLGLLSKYALLKRDVSEGCTSCGVCGNLCQGGALSEESADWRNTECLACFDCDDICPGNAVRFGFGRKTVPAMDLGRRQVILSTVSGIIAVPLIRSVPLSTNAYSVPALIRPPGALKEEDFLKRCVKCGECMKVCITNGLQPALLEAGIEGIWSPRLIPRIGYCEYRCTLCGHVCPSGAIQKMSLEEKTKIRIGLAMIDKGRCLPYSHATPCIVCEEVCPTSPKAIWFEETIVKNREAKEFPVKQPHVDLKLCIGCGICEAKCPVGSRPAIYVTNVGESRSKTNQLLLS